jgi:DNA-binding response OmpR family regulator
LRLLVIEDEDRLSGILKSKLGETGFTVDIAASAEDAGIALASTMMRPFSISACPTGMVLSC